VHSYKSGTKATKVTSLFQIKFRNLIIEVAAVSKTYCIKKEKLSFYYGEMRGLLP